MVNSYQIKAIGRYYKITEILLTISPIMCVIYLNFGAINIGTNILEVIQGDPKLLVMFLSAMVNPFIAYLLIFMERKIVENDISYSVVNLIILIVAELLFQNMVFLCLLGFLLYKIIKLYNVSVRECFKEKSKNKFFTTISGGVVVIVIAAICLFATIRINI